MPRRGVRKGNLGTELDARGAARAELALAGQQLAGFARVVELVHPRDERGQRGEPGERRIAQHRLQELRARGAAVHLLVGAPLELEQGLVQGEEGAAGGVVHAP